MNSIKNKLIIFVVLLGLLLYGCSVQDYSANNNDNVPPAPGSIAENNQARRSISDSQTFQALTIADLDIMIPKLAGVDDDGNQLFVDQVSQGFVVNNSFNETTVFFITYNSECMAWLAATNVDGEIISHGISYQPIEAVTNAIRYDIPIAIFAVDIGALFIQTEYESILLTAFENPEDLPRYFPEAFNASYEKSVIVLSDLE